MSGRLERLVLHAPHPIRVLGANVQSWQLDRLRRGGNWPAICRENDFQRYQDLSWDDLQAKQNQRLAKTIRRAVQHVPYYRELTDHLPEVETVADLTSFPTLSKNQARQAGDKLLDDEYRQQRYFVGHTSGTTGTPFTCYLTFPALRTRFSMRDCFYAWHGCNFEELNLRLGGRLFMPASRQKPPFWLLDRVTNQLMFSVYHMSDDTMATFVKPLEKYKPSFVTGYPSAIYTLARFCSDKGISFSPRVVFTDSETLLEHQREVIEAAWHCKVYDYYGMETGWLAGQCSHGKYHLSPLTSVLEILDEEGTPQKPGCMGEIVTTDLTNPLMPLIRYRTGDIGLWSEEPCDCGWHTPALERVVGRVDDIIVLPNGRKIGRLDSFVFKHSNHIYECQIVQETPSTFTFLLVPEPGYTLEIQRQILDETYARLGHDVTVTVRLVDTIPRTSRGKFRAVISKVNPNPASAS
jgi:phenylacetate-CoA ligase